MLSGVLIYTTGCQFHLCMLSVLHTAKLGPSLHTHKHIYSQKGEHTDTSRKWVRKCFASITWKADINLHSTLLGSRRQKHLRYAENFISMAEMQLNKLLLKMDPLFFVGLRDVTELSEIGPFRIFRLTPKSKMVFILFIRIIQWLDCFLSSMQCVCMNGWISLWSVKTLWVVKMTI